jgi:tRNA(fMet)-specific endonuclease VapC
MTYAMDTNAILEYLNGQKSVTAKFINAVTHNTPIVIPKVVDYEVMRGFYHKQHSDKEIIYNQLKIFCPITEITPAMWNRAAQIWAQLLKMNIRIGDADLLIASQCLINGYTLVTNNVSDFSPIDGMVIEDWETK